MYVSVYLFQSDGDKWSFKVPNDEGTKCDFIISQDGGRVCMIICLWLFIEYFRNSQVPNKRNYCNSILVY